MATNERHYFQRRALQEVESAMRADSIEAEIAHAGLAGLHLRRCAGCSPRRTRECRDCALVNVCDYPLGERQIGARGSVWRPIENVLPIRFTGVRALDIRRQAQRPAPLAVGDEEAAAADDPAEAPGHVLHLCA